ncbi:DUF928 domain-containing protein [Leptolyngbya iicbica]|nr:DUF928 domain-containing protein [Leptolyngbya sp. LK]
MISTSTKRISLALPISGLMLATAMVWPAVAQDQNEFPGRRIGGGTRGGCVINAAGVIAINPENNLGVTQREAPTLYFAVPATAEPYQVTFYLETEDAEPLYETTVAAGDKAELIGVQLPADTLTAGEYYPWSFAANCDETNPATAIVVNGWLQQTALDSEAIAEAESPLAQVQAYQAAGLWSDAIALTAELLAANPDCEEYQAQWSALLEALGLEQAIDAPMSVRLPM